MKLKKITSIALSTFAMFIFVFGCSNGDDGNNSTTASSVATTQKETTTKVVENTTEEVTTPEETTIEKQNKALIKTIKKYRVYSDESQLIEQEYYDELGNLIKVQEYSAGDPFSREEYNYDTNGNVVEIRRITTSNEVLIRTEITYNNNYREKDFKEYTERRGLETHIKYLYDEKGNLIEERNMLGCEFNKKTYEYDKYGNITKIFTQRCFHNYTEDKCDLLAIELFYVNEYDKYNKILKITEKLPSGETPDGKVNKYTEYIYDEYGRILKITEKLPSDETPDGKVKKYTDYIYDAKGNLIKENKFCWWEEKSTFFLDESMEYEYDILERTKVIKHYYRGELDNYMEYDYYE